MRVMLFVRRVAMLDMGNVGGGGEAPTFLCFKNRDGGYIFREEVLSVRSLKICHHYGLLYGRLLFGNGLEMQ